MDLEHTFAIFRIALYLISWIAIFTLWVCQGKIVDMSKEIALLSFLSILIASWKIFEAGTVWQIPLLLLALLFPYMAIKYIISNWIYVHKTNKRMGRG